MSMFLRRFFVPEMPPGYRPGSLLARIAMRDLPQMECAAGEAKATIRASAGRIDVRERVRRDFLQHTALAVFGMGDAHGQARACARHTGTLGRKGVRFEGDPLLSRALGCPDVVTALLPLDFTRLEVSGIPGAFRIEIETYGGAEVVLRLPKMRRYVQLGRKQCELLLGAFEAIANALSGAAKGGRA